MTKADTTNSDCGQLNYPALVKKNSETFALNESDWKTKNLLLLIAKKKLNKKIYRI